MVIRGAESSFILIKGAEIDSFANDLEENGEINSNIKMI